MFLLAFVVVVLPISPTSIEDFISVNGLKNYSAIPGIWYNSSFFVSLKIKNVSLAQPINVNISFSADQKNAKVIFIGSNWTTLSCFPSNNSCISKEKEIPFKFIVKNATPFQLKLYITAKLINQTASETQTLEISTNKIFSSVSAIIDAIKNFVSTGQNKEILLLIIAFIFGMLSGFFLLKKRRKIKFKGFEGK